MRGETRVIDLLSIIDWLMRLPREVEKRVMEEVHTLERNVTMPFLSSAERFGIEKGLPHGDYGKDCSKDC